MSKPILFILSDIYGTIEQNWILEYESRLLRSFQVEVFDCKELANIKANDVSDVHTEFLNGGIERAVMELESLEHRPTVILGFSIGGTIAWKFASKTKTPSIYLVSATRIRKESWKPSSDISLYFGENDTHRSSEEWMKKLNLKATILEEESHECYRQEKVVELVCADIVEHK